MNNPSSSPNKYYKINFEIPLVDHIISQLTSRFDNIIRLLPSRICVMDKSELEQLIN